MEAASAGAQSTPAIGGCTEMLDAIPKHVPRPLWLLPAVRFSPSIAASEHVVDAVARIGLHGLVGGMNRIRITAAQEMARARSEPKAAKAQGSNGLRRIPRCAQSIARSASPVQLKMTLPRM